MFSFCLSRWDHIHLSNLFIYIYFYIDIHLYTYNIYRQWSSDVLWSQVLFLWQTEGDGSGLDGQMLSYPKDPEWKRLDLVFWYPFGDLTALGAPCCHIVSGALSCSLDGMDQREGTDPPVTPTRSGAWIAWGKFFLLLWGNQSGQVRFNSNLALNWYLDDIDRRYGLWLHPILPSVFRNTYATSNDPGVLYVLRWNVHLQNFFAAWALDANEDELGELPSTTWSNKRMEPTPHGHWPRNHQVASFSVSRVIGGALGPLGIEAGRCSTQMENNPRRQAYLDEF